MESIYRSAGSSGLSTESQYSDQLQPQGGAHGLCILRYKSGKKKNERKGAKFSRWQAAPCPALIYLSTFTKSWRALQIDVSICFLVFWILLFSYIHKSGTEKVQNISHLASISWTSYCFRGVVILQLISSWLVQVLPLHTAGGAKE